MKYEYKSILIGKKYLSKKEYLNTITETLNDESKNGFRLVSIVCLDNINAMNGNLLCVLERELD